MSAISIRGVEKVFQGNSGEIRALDPIDLEIKAGEFICFVGPSGCGKSTLLFIVAGLTKSTDGKVLSNGKVVTRPGPDRTVVFQNDAVFPWMTVSENIGYGLRFKQMPQVERVEIVRRLTGLVGLERFRDAYPKELSGGMRKRVDLARAYATDPDVLLMDEPFGALDAFTKEKMQVDLSDLTTAETRRKTVLFVTHDLEEAIFLADRIVVMSSRPGRIISVVNVPFRRARDASIRIHSEFQEIRGSLREMLEKTQ
jgi:NitT/TauT family transport system ATP-binding protein